jgi:hypothetical protein
MNYYGKDIVMYSVNSSCIAEVGYEEENEIVLIRFNNCALYAYLGVCRQEFENLRTASSVGSYFYENIRNLYPYERIN